MDKLSALTAFCQVVEKGNFAAGARELGLSRSQVNRHVINLEDELGVQLLNRTTRSVSLTPIGDSYYKRAKAIINDLREADLAIQSEHEEPQGDIRINAPMSFGFRHLSKAMVAFMSLHPKIKLQLVLSDQFIDPIAEGFDVTVRIAERKNNSSLIEHEIGKARRVLCASPAFLLKHGEPKVPNDLTKLPCLHYGNLPTGNSWRLENKKGVTDVRVNGLFCSNNADVLNEAAIEGLGIALLPVFIAGPDLRAGKLVPVLKGYTAPNIYLSLLYAPNRHLSTRIRLFVKFIQDWFELSDF